MSFGQTLRAAREAKGLSTSELAAQTHLLVQIVEGLENEDFRRIPAPIYGRGFVKLYCETVGLDPKPLQAEFMTLYNQKKDAPGKAPPPPPKPAPVAPPPPKPEPAPEPEPVIAPPPPEPEPASEQEPEPAPEPEPIIAPPSEPEPTPAPEPIIAPPPEPEPAPEPEPVIEPPPPDSEPKSASPRRSYGELFEQAYAAAEAPAKPSPAEKFHNTMSNVSSGVFATVKRLPPNTGRIAIVVVAALILLVAIAWGIFELYKATSGAQTPETAPTQTVQVPATPTETSPKASDKTTAPETKAKPTPKTPKATGKQPTTKPATAKPATKSKGLKSSGVEVPSLYID